MTSDRTRLIRGVLLGAAVYFVGLFVIPSLGPVRGLTGTTALSSGDVTQAVYFIVSMTLMLVLGKGRLATYGFRPAPIKPVMWAVLISVGVELAMLFVMAVSVSLFGGPPRMPQQAGQMGMSLNRTIVSVWLLASTCEELFFRGLLYGYLAPLRASGFSFLGRHVSLPVTCCAVMFGLGHLCLPGMMPPVVAHMTFNVVGYSIPLLMGAQP